MGIFFSEMKQKRPLCVTRISTRMKAKGCNKKYLRVFVNNKRDSASVNIWYASVTFYKIDRILMFKLRSIEV